MKRVMVLAIALVALAAASRAEAGDVPNVITVQGVLRNAGGAVVNGVYSLTFKLYTAQTQGQLLWSEVQSNVVVDNGLYSATLGTTSPLPASLFSQNVEVWLGVSVEGQQELPRVRMTTVAFAFHARSAMNAEKAAGVECTGCIQEAALAFKPVTEANLAAKAVQAVKDSGQFLLITGGTLTGSLNVTGLVTAVKFVGDGSGLTGVSSPQGTCQAGWFVSGIQANGALVCKEGASAISSVNGLKGGTITGDVDVTGGITSGGAEVCTIDGNCGETLGQLLCKANQVAMWNGTSWICSSFVKDVPAQACDGVNNVLAWDGSKFSCKTLTGTGPSGGAAQGFELLDSWGYTWDGMMRPAMTYADAEAKCKELGARLPTATELYRVSQNETKLFGPMATGDCPWTAVRYSSTGHAMGRMNDGNIEYGGDTSSYNFRCVWGNNTKKYFTGNHCYGPPGDECWPMALMGNKYVMDKYDRPWVRYSVASAECNFYYSHLTDPMRLAQAIRAGISNGTNNYLVTSDGVEWYSTNMRYHVLFRWSNVNMNFNAYWDEANGGHDGSEYRFRCVGVSAAHGATPVQVQNAVTTTNYLTTTTADEGATSPNGAIDACFKKGGHLATSNDLYELIQGKLAGGSDQWLWTADWIGNWSGHWWLQLVKWAGTISGIDPADGNHTTNGSRSDGTNRPYRCVWYPVDTEYNGPANCNGGCYAVTVAATNPPVKMWMDKQDRSSTHWAGAVQACYLAGGFLPGFRDYVEMIRQSLPNGSNNWLHTAEFQRMHSGNHPLETILKWAGEVPSFTEYTEPNWSSNSDSRPYRCFWTNELR
ncbi:MAG: hypothetical protein FJ109_10185 [Deltaproteobacteria bacterium]|nr:hypothetical protein [Deltaproteobacteria bacterium]